MQDETSLAFPRRIAILYELKLTGGVNFFPAQACFTRRISIVSNAIQTIDNKVSHFIIYCLNCIRRD